MHIPSPITRFYTMVCIICITPLLFQYMFLKHNKWDVSLKLYFRKWSWACQFVFILIFGSRSQCMYLSCLRHLILSFYNYHMSQLARGYIWFVMRQVTIPRASMDDRETRSIFQATRNVFGYHGLLHWWNEI